MKILAVGGGSGGHVTPIVAVLKALREQDESAEFEVWTDRKFYIVAQKSLANIDTDVPVRRLSSGKLRRYYTMPLWKQALSLRTIVIPNIIDTFKIITGFLQSLWRLSRNRPDVIFCKGGFVCLPVGLAAKFLSIPVVLHDSDAHPGLTNRILSKSARFVATGAPLKHYGYSSEKGRYVGVPIDARYTPVSDAEQANAKRELGFDAKRPLVVITGGGLGARAINEAVRSVIDELLTISNVFLIAGEANFPEFKQLLDQRNPDTLRIEPFVGSHMVTTLQAADIVVARAGATTLLELAGLAKPTIIIPNPLLTGGHQLKNAKVYEEAGAAVVLDEEKVRSHPNELLDTVNALLLRRDEMMKLGEQMHAFAKPRAAHDVAKLVIEAATQS